MIPLSQLADRLAAHITQQTGIAAYAQRISTRVYPMYALSLLPRETRPADGGQQLFRCLTVSIACYPSRQREENSGLDMADKLLTALWGGLSVSGRWLTPMACRCREADNILTVEFELEFYDLPCTLQAEDSAVAMETLVLGMDTGEPT